jgi:Type IV secretory system Conjugative DNA transfer
MGYRPPRTPYCGFDRDEHGRRVLAESGAHVLVSGPTGRGKTRRILAPAAVLWGGPAVVVSSKDDLLQLVMQRRYGPSALIDLRPDYDADYPGIDMLSFDPTKLISTPDQAVTTANTMMQMSAVGLGSGIDQVSDGGIWESNTEGPLAAMLYAASPKGNNAGIEWVLLAVDNLSMTKVGQQISTEPGWFNAARIVADKPLFSNALMRTLDMDPKQRDSIALTMRKAVMPWMRLALRGITHPPFDESFLNDPTATLFVLAPPEGSIAGAAVTLLEHLVKVWRAKTARKEMMHRLLYVIDEATNVAPMPALRRHIGEGRGLGVNFLVAVQASSQFDTVYGGAYARELRDIFPAALIMYGAAEMDMLRRAEEWSLQTTRRQESFDQASGAKLLSSHLGSTLDYRRLMPENEDHARLWLRGTEGIKTEIPEWSQFIGCYDHAVRKALGEVRPRQAPQNVWEWMAHRHRTALMAARNGRDRIEPPSEAG